MRQQTWDTHEQHRAVAPARAAPAINFLGGYEIGVKLQDSGEPNNLQRTALAGDRRARRYADAAEERVALLRHQDRRAGHDRAGRAGAPVRGRRRVHGQGLDRRRAPATATTAWPGRRGAARSASACCVTPVLVGEPMTFRLSRCRPRIRRRQDRGAARRPRRRAVPAGSAGRARRRLALRLRVGGRLPPPRRLVVHRARHRRGPRRQPRHRRLRHAVVGAAAVPVRTDFRRAKGRISRAKTKRPRLHVRRRVARSGRRRERERQALARRRLQGQEVQAPQAPSATAGASARSTMRVMIRRPRKTGFYYGSVRSRAARPARRRRPVPAPPHEDEEEARRASPTRRRSPRCPGYKP